MAAVLPMVLQFLPLLPGLIDTVVKLVHIVKSDPATPEDVKAQLDELSLALDKASAAVAAARLPAPQV